MFMYGYLNKEARALVQKTPGSWFHCKIEASGEFRAGCQFCARHQKEVDIFSGYNVTTKTQIKKYRILGHQNSKAHVESTFAALGLGTPPANLFGASGAAESGDCIDAPGDDDDDDAGKDLETYNLFVVRSCTPVFARHTT